MRSVTTVNLRESIGFWLRATADSVAPLPTPPPRPRSAIELEHERWSAAHGDKILRLEYPLTRASVVLDIGGYEGQWASDIFSRYLCNIHVFEPVPEYAECIRTRFKSNPDIRVYDFGLGATDRFESFAVSGDASSGVRKFENVDSTEVKLTCASRILNDLGIKEIALAKINIEGGEYELLQHLLDEEVVRNIADLQIQFHDFVPDAEAKMKRLQDQLTHTHQLTYQYRYIWENWRRRT